MERGCAVVLACVLGGACSSDAGLREAGADMSSLLDAAVGDASAERDAGGVDLINADAVDRGAPVLSPDPSPPVVLTLLPSPDPERPFQHAAEVSIAAHDGHVVIAAINLHTDGPATLETSSLLRGVGIAVSHDFGATFEPTADPGLVAAGATDTSDPVVRAGADGSFWFSTIATDPNRGMLLRSATNGHSWDIVESALPLRDKEWLAAAPDGGLVMAANGGLWWFDAAGTVRASYLRDPDWPVMGAYVDARGAHFVLERSVVLWTGAPSWAFEGSLIAATPDWTPGWSVPIGPSGDGGTWAIYDRQRPTDQGRQSVVELRLFAAGDTTGQAIPISAPGVPAFMPAAAMDSDGRVHVVWYESAGPSGVLMYARSADRDLRMGFGAPRVVDPAACPGQGWVAEPTQSAPDRRLREYIDLAVDGRRVHAAWTHAPALPARIYTSHWDF